MFENDTLLLVISFFQFITLVVLYPVLKWAITLEKRLIMLETIEKIKGKNSDTKKG